MESVSPNPQLHPMVSGFEDARTYDLGRPRYEAAVVDELIDLLGLSAGDPVLELGAGTGRLPGRCTREGSI